MFVDIHHHLIYGVDDGAKSFEGTVKMIRQAVENQVHAIITTPHITPGYAPFPMEDYRARLEETRAYLEKEQIGLQLYPGSEILYTPAAPYQLSEGKVPTLAGTRYALVEFSPDDPFQDLSRAARDLSEMGYLPVFAHAERYECLKKADQVRRLRKEWGVLIQVNAATMLRKYGFFRQRLINRLFEDGLVDFIGTDCHDMPGRDNHMAEAFERLNDLYGAELAHALTHGNAEKLLNEARA